MISTVSRTAATVVLLALAAPAQSNATLLSVFKVPGESGFNDVWGYASPAGKEYAILGGFDAAYVIDCTDPRNPVQRGVIPGSASGWSTSGWRDMRVYGHYLYIVTEGGGGVQIVDMANPDQPVLVRTAAQQYWGSAHNVAIDTATGTLYACGTNVGMVICDISHDPLDPRRLTSFTQFRVHDLQIQDGFAHLAEINSDRYEIVDVSALPALTSVSVSGVVDCHNVWPTRDNRYALTTSERVGGEVKVFDISDKRLPLQIAKYHAGSAVTSVHNAYLRDRVAHISYYTEGYRAVDVSDPAHPVEVAYWDTSTLTSTYAGDWGCYPFQPSGVIYASDRQNGLYVIGTPATATNYGTGTAGSGGKVPALRPFGAAYKGNASYGLQTWDARPNANVTLALGAAPGSLPVAGATILLDLTQPVALLGATTDAAGEVVVPLPIPAAVSSGRLYAQMLVADPMAPGGLAASPGLQVDVF